jgi:DNA-binding GntR family transcriptional regulator
MYTRIHGGDASVTLHETLKQEILSGRLAPGTLLSQTNLAARFGVSRIPIRDTLQALAAERLVTVVPNKGARVIELDGVALREIFELRELLECDLIDKATQCAQPSDHAEIEYALRKSELEAGRAGWRESDWLFHHSIYKVTKRDRQIELVRELRDACAVHAAHYDDLMEETPRWLDQHRKIFAAFRHGNAERSQRLLAEHIQQAGKHLLMLMNR